MASLIILAFVLASIELGLSVPWILPCIQFLPASLKFHLRHRNGTGSAKETYLSLSSFTTVGWSNATLTIDIYRVENFSTDTNWTPLNTANDVELRLVEPPGDRCNSSTKVEDCFRVEVKTDDHFEDAIATVVRAFSAKQPYKDAIIRSVTQETDTLNYLLDGIVKSRLQIGSISIDGNTREMTTEAKLLELIHSTRPSQVIVGKGVLFNIHDTFYSDPIVQRMQKIELYPLYNGITDGTLAQLKAADLTLKNAPLITTAGLGQFFEPVFDGLLTIRKLHFKHRALRCSVAEKVFAGYDMILVKPNSTSENLFTEEWKVVPPTPKRAALYSCQEDLGYYVLNSKA